MASFIISTHAAQRYVERIDPSATIAEARDAIRSHARAIEAAVSMGCRSVRLGSGVRLVIEPADAVVLTVLPAQPKVRSVQHSGTGFDFRATRRFAWKEQGNA